jgi:hypothetical protein
MMENVDGSARPGSGGDGDSAAATDPAVASGGGVAGAPTTNGSGGSSAGGVETAGVAAPGGAETGGVTADGSAPASSDERPGVPASERDDIKQSAADRQPLTFDPAADWTSADRLGQQPPGEDHDPRPEQQPPDRDE